jgi:hypothetical protein
VGILWELPSETVDLISDGDSQNNTWESPSETVDLISDGDSQNNTWESPSETGDLIFRRRFPHITDFQTRIPTYCSIHKCEAF